MRPRKHFLQRRCDSKPFNFRKVVTAGKPKRLAIANKGALGLKVRDLTLSRARWKQQTVEAQAQVATLTAQLQQAQQQLATTQLELEQLRLKKNRRPSVSRRGQTQRGTVCCFFGAVAPALSRSDSSLACWVGVS